MRERGFFSSLLYTDLVEPLEAKFTKAWLLPIPRATLQSVLESFDLPPGGSVYPNKLDFSAIICLSHLRDSDWLRGLSSPLSKEKLLSPFLCSALSKFPQISQMDKGLDAKRVRDSPRGRAVTLPP